MKMNKQKLEQRIEKAHSARRSARADVERAYVRFLRVGTTEALDDYAEATAKAEALADVVDKISEREECRKQKKARTERLNELFREFLDAHDRESASLDDVESWAKRTDRDLPEKPGVTATGRISVA